MFCRFSSLASPASKCSDWRAITRTAEQPPWYVEISNVSICSMDINHVQVIWIRLTCGNDVMHRSKDCTVVWRCCWCCEREPVYIWLFSYRTKAVLNLREAPDWIPCIWSISVLRTPQKMTTRTTTMMKMTRRMNPVRRRRRRRCAF